MNYQEHLHGPKSPILIAYSFPCQNLNRYVWILNHGMVRNSGPYVISTPAKQLSEARLQLHTHPSTDSTGNDSALQFLLDQYQHCQQDHVKCRYSIPDDQIYPKRLIDVASDEQGLIRLCEGSTGPYTALSHCWGAAQPFTLTEITASELHHGLSLDRLPQTFQDAVTVTRKACLQYIWIDSL
jgi:hypothetical protein